MINLKKIKSSGVMQQDETDCGVCCLLSILRYFDGEESLEKLRKMSGTSKTGTTLLGLYEAANKLGFKSDGCESTIDDLIEYGKPAILHCLIEDNLEHFVLCFSYEGSKFIVFDPAKGLIHLSTDELDSIWKSHYCLILEPTNKIVSKVSISEIKKKWINNLIKKDYGILGSSIAIGLVISVLGMTTAIFSQKMIDELIPNKEYTKLWMGILLLLVLLGARICLSAIRSFLLLKQSKVFNNRIIGAFYNKLLLLPRIFFDTRKTGEMIARMNDTQRIQNVITNIIGDFIINSLSALMTLCFLFYYNWFIGITLTISAPFFIWTIYRYNQPIIDSQRNVMVNYAQSESNFINTILGIETIRSLNKQNMFTKLNRTIYGRYQESVFKLGKLNIKLSLISGLISVIVLMSIISLGCYFIFNGKMKLGELMAVISLVSTIIPAIVSLSLISIPINEAKVAFNRMFEFVNTEPEKFEGNEINTRIDTIDITNISFRFPGRTLLLYNISMKFKRGEISFVIGESGCGKSTLCHIVERTYIPESGDICINGEININEFSLNEYRKRIGVMPQDIFIFNGTVLDNILLGVDCDKIKMEDIVRKTSELGFDRYINELPQGYMTIVGEEGINLSGGQKQIIALLRLVLKNPEIMLLDEPTSAMDRDLEKFTMELLNSMKHDKIVIFISHRLHLLRHYADNIYLIEAGKIIASGKHKIMMNTKNLYSNYLNDIYNITGDRNTQLK